MSDPSPNASPNATVGSVHQNRPVGAIPGKASARQLQAQQTQRQTPATRRHEPRRKDGRATAKASHTPRKKGTR
jgi:hypothetical protein